MNIVNVILTALTVIVMVGIALILGYQSKNDTKQNNNQPNILSNDEFDYGHNVKHYSEEDY